MVIGKSAYSKKIIALSAKIFGEISPNVKEPNAKAIVTMMAEKPLDKDEVVSMNYYPRYQEMDLLTRGLREIGLYRDEMQDIKDEMERRRFMRGKSRLSRWQKFKKSEPTP
ncbi:hypothetical protein GJ496_002431 [Pomphorhynchus laevis]|nr:hypothetical protein GJ496_002431 [Pomphorhynchus laevis]